MMASTYPMVNGVIYVIIGKIGAKHVVFDARTEEPLQAYATPEMAEVGAHEWEGRLRTWAERKAR
jgi:hypothetical protein